MVKRKTALNRAAFTMIELIFAIVVVSIAVLSLPMIIQTTSRGIEDSITQEAIFAASAELMGATSYYWDLNSMEDADASRLERVIEVNGACNADRLRLGHINQPYHRRCLDSNTTVVASTPDINIPPVFPNLDNAVHGDQTIFDNPAADAASYKEAYTGTMAIAQGLGDANVKLLTATIRNSDGDTVTSLSIYSANIGEIDYYRRRF